MVRARPSGSESVAIELHEASSVTSVTNLVPQNDDKMILASVRMNTLLLLGKLAAAVMSLSPAILASLIDSGVDVLVQAALFFAAKAARRGATSAMYPVGRGQLEPVAVVVCAALKVAGMVAVIFRSLDLLLDADRDLNKHGCISGHDVHKHGWRHIWHDHWESVLLLALVRARRRPTSLIARAALPPHSLPPHSLPLHSFPPHSLPSASTRERASRRDVVTQVSAIKFGFCYWCELLVHGRSDRGLATETARAVIACVHRDRKEQVTAWRAREQRLCIPCRCWTATRHRPHSVAHHKSPTGACVRFRDVPCSDNWNDVVLSVGALVATIITQLSQELWFVDPTVACVLAVYVLHFWLRSGREQVDLIVGRAAEPSCACRAQQILHAMPGVAPSCGHARSLPWRALLRRALEAPLTYLSTFSPPLPPLIWRRLV